MTMENDLAERLRSIDHMSIEDCFTQSPLYEQAADRIQALEAELARKTEALEIIAGVRPCIDNLMGNVDIARSALEEKTDV